MSSFVSLGDKVDVSGNDLLQWWVRDQRPVVPRVAVHPQQ
ncbi:hypothetical protein AB0M28_35380 [Streptomyces sp. NPDC051940]